MTWALRRPSRESVEHSVDVYDLLASVIAKRTMGVRAGVQGSSAYTDGVTIYVDPGAPAERRLEAVVVQAALIRAESLERDVMRRLVGRKRLSRRYLAIEGRRAVAAVAELVPGVTSLAHLGHEAGPSGGPMESLALARRGRGHALPESFGTIRPRLLLASPLDPAADDVEGESDRTFWLDEDEDDTVSSEQRKAPRSSRAGPPKLGAVSTVARTDGSLICSAAAPTAVERESRDVKGTFDLVYPEWDRAKGRYLPDWCTVFETPPSRNDLADFDFPRRLQVQRALARLGVDLETCRRQLQGDGLDIDAVVESFVDLHSGFSSDEAVYLGNRRRGRNLAVLILLDISASVGEKLLPGEEVHDVQRRTAGELTSALEALGDRVALYGFRSLGRSVEFVTVKTFDHRFERVAIQRLGGLRPSGYTRIGAAIRHGSHLLTTRSGTTRKLLVVLSDAISYDIGYEGAHGEADCSHALGEARASGVGCLCLTIGSPGSDALDRVFGGSAYARADKFDDLFNDLGPVFRNAISSADSSRRVAAQSSMKREV